MKITSVPFLSYDPRGVPSINDTAGASTPGTLLCANLLNPIFKEPYNAIRLSGVDPQEDNARLLEALKRHQRAILANNGQNASTGRKLADNGSSILASLSKLSQSRITSNKMLWARSVQGMENALNHRLDRINAAMAEMSTAFTGGIFPSAKDTPQCLRCDGRSYDPVGQWQLHYVLHGQGVPNIGGYFLRGASAGGNPSKVLTARPDTVYFGVEANADIGSFTNHHDTSYHIEYGSNKWPAATGCFQETATSGWREVYPNGGKKSKDSDIREDQVIGLNLALINTYRAATETRPKCVSFDWVMFAGLKHDTDFLPYQPNPYIQRVMLNMIPLSVGPGGTVSPGNVTGTGSSTATPMLAITYDPSTVTIAFKIPAAGQDPVGRNGDTPTTTIPAPKVTDMSGNAVSGISYNVTSAPTINGQPIAYYVNLLADENSDESDSSPDMSALDGVVSQTTGAISFPWSGFLEIWKNGNLANYVGSSGQSATIALPIMATGASGSGSVTLSFVLNNVT